MRRGQMRDDGRGIHLADDEGATSLRLSCQCISPLVCTRLTPSIDQGMLQLCFFQHLEVM